MKQVQVKRPTKTREVETDLRTPSGQPLPF